MTTIDRTHTLFDEIPQVEGCEHEPNVVEAPSMRVPATTNHDGDDYMSFRLDPGFVGRFENVPVEWGFPVGGGLTLGEITFLQKYSRLMEDGTKETWDQCVERVVEGMYSIQRNYCKNTLVSWDDRKAQESAQEAFERHWAMKWTAPGRGLATMGTRFVGQFGSASLQNCSFWTSEDMAHNPTKMFVRLMEESMLGIGVGFDTRGAGTLRIVAPEKAKREWAIPDSREGWCESLRLLLASYFAEGGPTWEFDYSLIRPAGMPLKSFGGTASGPGPLRRLHESIREQFDGREGQLITSRDIVDLANKIGQAVVAGAKRRSAEIALGSVYDEDYIALKDWNNPSNAERTAPGTGWAWTSNNSVLATVDDDLSHIAPLIAVNGEPGIVFSDLITGHGRLSDGPDGKDLRVRGVNPCVTDTTWVMTTMGPRQVRDLIGVAHTVLVDGKPYDTESQGFFRTGVRDVYLLETASGHSVEVTYDHRMLTANRGWVEAGELVHGDELLLNEHFGIGWDGEGTLDEGYVVGHFLGDGKAITEAIETASSNFTIGLLRGLFDTDGHVEGSTGVDGSGARIVLSQSDRSFLQGVQRMLGRLGILSTIYPTHEAGPSVLPDGKGGECAARWRLVISGSRAVEYMDRIGFADTDKAAAWDALAGSMTRGFCRKAPVAAFTALTPIGEKVVYDVTVADIHAFDANGLIAHNCAEMQLESGEKCTLVEVHLNRATSKEDFLRTLKFAFLYAKTVTLLPTHWEDVNTVMARNRRIGVGLTGVALFYEKHGIEVLREWMCEGYDEISRWDRIYSEWLCVRESVRTTTVKPAGSTSLLSGATPGVHWPTRSGEFLRTMRFAIGHELLPVLEAAGFEIEPDAQAPETAVVVSFATDGPTMRDQYQVTLWQKAMLAAEVQRWWADNAVSVTLTFRQYPDDPVKDESQQIPDVISMFKGQLKTMSFLGIDDGGTSYVQAPYQPIDHERYAELRGKIGTVDRKALYTIKAEAAGERYCDGESCVL